MKGLAGWLLVLALMATPAFAQDAKPKDAPAEGGVSDSMPTAVDDEPEEGSLAATMKDVEDYLDKLPIKFYGHLKLDMAYDSGRTNDGNTAMWVVPQPDGADNEYNMTARHTRFGMTYDAPESWGPKAFGRIEIDFYGGSPEFKPGVRLRHAYMLFEWESGWELLAGLTWDVPMPLWQWKLNTAVGWNQGNTAFRRPQLRGAYKSKLGEDGHWKIAVAIADPIARDIDGLGDDDGEDAGLPDFQGRLSFTFKLFDAKKKTEIGVGGIYGKREADIDDHDDTYTAWLYGIDLLIPITNDVRVLAEFYDSQAASSYNASLAMDYNKTLDTEIRAHGGYVNVIWKINKYWMVVGGYGVCDPKDGDLSAGNRSRNTSAFANVRFKLTKQAWIGLEYDRMETDYKDADTASNNRVQMSFCLKF